MSASTLPLIRFLLARLDEADARLTRRSRHLRDVHDDAVLQHETQAIAHEREDVLAVRRVVGSAQQLIVLRDLPSEQGVRDLATQMIISLASPYCAHPAFRSEWAALAPEPTLASTA